MLPWKRRSTLLLTTTLSGETLALLLSSPTLMTFTLSSNILSYAFPANPIVFFSNTCLDGVVFLPGKLMYPNLPYTLPSERYPLTCRDAMLDES